MQAKAVGIFPDDEGNASVRANSSSPSVYLPEFLSDLQLERLLLPLADVQVCSASASI